MIEEMPLRKKFIILLISFALANVGLHAIINFHFYRIFGQELAQIENEFIKKDESYLSVKPDSQNSSSFTLDFSAALISDSKIVCSQKFGIIIISCFHCSPQLPIGNFSNSPTRGSPQI